MIVLIWGNHLRKNPKNKKIIYSNVFTVTFILTASN